MSELIRPHYLDQRSAFDKQFAGMSETPFSYETYEEVREQLVIAIHKSLTNNDREFLLSFKKGEPLWKLIPIDNLEYLPAVKWKLLNIQNLALNNPHRHAEMLKILETRLSKV